MKKSLQLSFILLFNLILSGYSQNPVLVKDINTTFSSEQRCTVNGITYFVGQNDQYGAELWKTDGTAAGTIMLKDINPGNGSSNIAQMINVNGTLFFEANDGVHGAELWKSDGTAVGTQLAKDIISGAGSGYISNLISYNNTLYFSALTSYNTHGLWKSDGTEAGTVIVKVTNPDYASTYGAGIFLEAKGKLFFVATNQTTGSELWMSDGTEAGTVLLKDINPGTYSSIDVNNTKLINANGTIYFVANDNVHGNELWKTDGTEAGTVLVKDIVPGAQGTMAILEQAKTIGGDIYFTAFTSQTGFELWKSDGTEAGTFMIKDINPGLSYSLPYNLLRVNSLMYFEVDTKTNGIELWKTDGTEAGTLMVKDLNPGSTSSLITNKFVINNTLYFSNVVDGNEALYKTDGTEAGTEIVKAISFSDPINFNSTTYFFSKTNENYNSIWKTDGTEAGTVLVKDFSSTGNYITSSAYISNGQLYFNVYKDSGIELWKSDGTEGGTTLASSLPKGISSSKPTSLMDVNGTLFFLATHPVWGTELWKTNGSAEGTKMVKDINPGNLSSNINNLTNCNQTLLFYNNKDLWKSDGTETGTSIIKAANSPIYALTAFGSTAYFGISNLQGGQQLWKSDGTETGTVMIKDITGPVETLQSFTMVNNTLFFKTKGANGYELWKSDGTEAGTTIVKTLGAGDAYWMTSCNNLLFFALYESTHGQELWKSDGTEAGTVMVKDINPGTVGSYPLRPLNLNNILYFSADNGTNGTELWKSDGTEAGTTMVKDINTGIASSSPDFLCNVNGVLFFQADKSGFGRELWKSDGTEMGTEMVKDIVSGANSGAPAYLVNAGNTLFFQSNNSIYKSKGFEYNTEQISNSEAITPYTQNFVVSGDNLFFGASGYTFGNELWKIPYKPNPTVKASAINVSNITGTTATISWANGDGSKRAVFVALKSQTLTDPTDGKNYVSNTTFGSGSEIETSGWYCIYNGTGSSVNISGLTANTAYSVYVSEYTDVYGNDYLTSTPVDFTTLKLIPTVKASAINVSNITGTGASISWTNGDGSKRAVFVALKTSPESAPSNGESYTANTTYGSGSQIETSGWYCIYNGTGSSVNILGLTANTTYSVMVSEYIDISGNQYLNSGPVDFTTLATDIPEAKEDNNVKIFPIPVSNNLNVEFDSHEKGAMLRIYTLNGALLKEKQASGIKNEIDMTEYPTGVYILKVETSKGTTVKQIVKQ